MASLSFHSTEVGLLVALVALGALVAIPFQKANVFSRARSHAINANNLTLKTEATWTSHLLRRTIFATLLPIVGICYAVVSTGPPMTVAAPAVLAAAVGFLSGLAIAECNGLMMESFDTSDLQPGMTGRPRTLDEKATKCNYSTFPRVTSAYAITHTFAYLFAAGATALGALGSRTLGQRTSTGIVAGILFFLTVLLTLAIVRFKEVQIVPQSRSVEINRWADARRESIRRASVMDVEPLSLGNDGRRSSRPDPMALQQAVNAVDAWRPVMIGNPVNRTRRCNLLELGAMTRWTEIRKKNRLIDYNENTHLNRAAIDAAVGAARDMGRRRV